MHANKPFKQLLTIDNFFMAELDGTGARGIKNEHIINQNNMIAEKNCFRKENDFRKQLPVDLKLAMEKRFFKMTREGMPPAQRTERPAACSRPAAFFPTRDLILHRKSVWIRSEKDTRSPSPS